MARSRKRTAAHRRRLLFIIPIVAIIVLAGVYALSIVPPAKVPLAQNYIFEMSIQISNSTKVQFVAPPAVGEAVSIGGRGAVWAINTYSSYGMDTLHYPIYIDSPANPYQGFSVVHVASRVAVNYTLYDLFAVWGQHLGQNETLNIPNEASFSWHMCVGTSSANLQPGLWGAQPLVPNIDVVLLYSEGSTCTSS